MRFSLFSKYTIFAVWYFLCYYYYYLPWKLPVTCKHIPNCDVYLTFKIFTLWCQNSGPRKFYPLKGVKCMWRAVTILLLPRFCMFYLNLHIVECIIALAWLLHHPAPLRCTRWRWEDLDHTTHHQTQTHNAACRQHTFTGTWVMLLDLHGSRMSLCIVLYSLGQTLTCWVRWCHIELSFVNVEINLADAVQSV